MSSLEVFNRGTTHGEESEKAQVFQKRRQRREERNAPLQEEHCKKRQRRQGWQSQKQKTGDRYRIVESPQEGEESAEETIAIEEAGRTAQRETGQDIPSIERLVRVYEKAFTQPCFRDRDDHTIGRHGKPLFTWAWIKRDKAAWVGLEPDGGLEVTPDKPENDF